jgi:glycosyltransferase involved in cell wall biosynthesis
VGNAIPPLTVGMPVYNGERYIADAIESIIGQTYGDFEFIISDNASTDGTEEICHTYAAQDGRITYSRVAENCGAAPNFNRVFLMARSEYFKFAASDDLCAPRFLELCMATYQDAPADLALCFPKTVKIDADGNPHGEIDEKMDLRQAEPHARFRAYLTNYWLSNCFYGVMRSAAYRSTRMLKSYDPSDLVLLGELTLRGQFWQLDEPFFLRRFHAGMSHQANRTAEEIQQWFDTTATRKVSRDFQKTRMFWEFLRAIDTSDLSTAERMRCRREFGRTWVRKYWKTIGREIVEGAGIPVPRRGRLRAGATADK